MSPVSLLSKHLEMSREQRNTYIRQNETLKNQIFENNLHIKELESEIEDLEKAIFKLS